MQYETVLRQYKVKSDILKASRPDSGDMNTADSETKDPAVHLQELKDQYVKIQEETQRPGKGEAGGQ